MSTYYYQQSFSPSFSRPVTYAVQRLILANVLVFAGQLIVQVPVAGLTDQRLDPEYWLAFQPNLFLRGCLWQAATYMFLHGGLWHLFFNMLTLYFFGPDIERILSTRQFFRFFILCGVMGALASLVAAIMFGNAAPVIGASGAVLGVLAAYATAYPQREIYIFPIPFPIYAWALALVLFIFSLTLDASNPGTAWAAHAGGMVFGFGYMKLTPSLLSWLERRAAARPRGKDPLDAVGEAVDNIFKFDEKKRKKK